MSQQDEVRGYPELDHAIERITALRGGPEAGGDKEKESGTGMI